MAATLADLETERHDRILNAALKEFTQQGYDNASTNVIAREAGFSKSLMFHYAGSKQNLFISVYEFFTDLMQKEYFALMNYKEKDIFKRLRQSYLLQIDLIKRYPFILDVKKLEQSALLYEKFDKGVKKRVRGSMDCYEKIWNGIDITKFKKGLNMEKSKELIFWANIGFTDKILKETLLRNGTGQSYSFNKKIVLTRLDQYFDELKKLFYK